MILMLLATISAVLLKVISIVTMKKNVVVVGPVPAPEQLENQMLVATQKVGQLEIEQLVEFCVVRGTPESAVPLLTKRSDREQKP